MFFLSSFDLYSFKVTKEISKLWLQQFRGRLTWPKVKQWHNWPTISYIKVVELENKLTPWPVFHRHRPQSKEHVTFLQLCLSIRINSWSSKRKLEAPVLQFLAGFLSHVDACRVLLSRRNTMSEDRQQAVKLNTVRCFLYVCCFWADEKRWCKQKLWCPHICI